MNPIYRSGYGLEDFMVLIIWFRFNATYALS